MVTNYSSIFPILILSILATRDVTFNKQHTQRLKLACQATIVSFISYLFQSTNVILEPIFTPRTAVDGFVARVGVNLLFDVTPSRTTINIRCLFQQGQELSLHLQNIHHEWTKRCLRIILIAFCKQSVLIDAIILQNRPETQGIFYFWAQKCSMLILTQ